MKIQLTQFIKILACVFALIPANAFASGEIDSSPKLVITSNRAANYNDRGSFTHYSPQLFRVANSQTTSIQQLIAYPVNSDSFTLPDGNLAISRGPTLQKVNPITGEVIRTISNLNSNIIDTARDGDFFFTLSNSGTSYSLRYYNALREQHISDSISMNAVKQYWLDSTIKSTAMDAVKFNRFAIANGIAALTVTDGNQHDIIVFKSAYGYLSLKHHYSNEYKPFIIRLAQSNTQTQINDIHFGQDGNLYVVLTRIYSNLSAETQLLRFKRQEIFSGNEKFVVDMIQDETFAHSLTLYSAPVGQMLAGHKIKFDIAGNMLVSSQRTYPTAPMKGKIQRFSFASGYTNLSATVLIDGTVDDFEPVWR